MCQLCRFVILNILHFNYDAISNWFNHTFVFLMAELITILFCECLFFVLVLSHSCLAEDTWKS